MNFANLSQSLQDVFTIVELIKNRLLLPNCLLIMMNHNVQEITITTSRLPILN